MLNVRVEGSLELRRVAAAIKAAGDKGLGKEMGAAMRKAGKPVQDSIRETLVKSMPERGGYRAVIAKSVRFRTALRAGRRDGAFRITTYAEGETERRDIKRLNKGELRHPVFGRSRYVRAEDSKTGFRRVPNPWGTTKVEPQFFERGTRDAADQAEAQMVEVIRVFRARIVKG